MTRDVLHERASAGAAAAIARMSEAEKRAYTLSIINHRRRIAERR